MFSSYFLVNIGLSCGVPVGPASRLFGCYGFAFWSTSLNDSLFYHLPQFCQGVWELLFDEFFCSSKACSYVLHGLGALGIELFGFYWFALPGETSLLLTTGWILPRFITLSRDSKTNFAYLSDNLETRFVFLILYREEKILATDRHRGTLIEELRAGEYPGTGSTSWQ